MLVLYALSLHQQIIINKAFRSGQQKQQKKMEDNLKEMEDFLINNGIATMEEIRLVTYINGYTAKSLNDILYVRTGYRDIEQLMEAEY